MSFELNSKKIPYNLVLINLKKIKQTGQSVILGKNWNYFLNKIQNYHHQFVLLNWIEVYFKSLCEYSQVPFQ